MRIIKHWNWTLVHLENYERTINLLKIIDTIENFVLVRWNEFGNVYDYAMECEHNKMISDKFFVIRTKNAHIRNNYVGITFFLNRNLFNSYLSKNFDTPELLKFYKLFNKFKTPIVPLYFYEQICPDKVINHLNNYKPLTLYLMPQYQNNNLISELDKIGYDLIDKSDRTWTIKLKPKSGLLVNKL